MTSGKACADLGGPRSQVDAVSGGARSDAGGDRRTARRRLHCDAEDRDALVVAQGRGLPVVPLTAMPS